MKRHLLFGFLFFLLSVFYFTDKSYAKDFETFVIDMIVDFGPADKPGYEGELVVEKGMTPADAVALLYPVMLGKTCCSLREIMEIGGVRVDPVENHWWKVTLNGSQKVSPKKKKLKEGDKLEWHYITEDQ